MYDIENIYEAVDIQDAIKALVENPSATVSYTHLTLPTN